MAQTSAQPLRIGIAGLGTVGIGIAKILIGSADLLAARGARPLVLTAVSSRDASKNRGVDLSPFAWETDARALAARDDVDVVVETIGGDGIAKELVELALANGKAVVTANKALLAVHGADLAQLADKNSAPLAYEAAVAGGIPAIKSVREGLAANRYQRVYGILNGTCNYILTAMTQEGSDFGAVLARAQELGYAELDPTFDVDGIDAAHKLAILASLAFGCQLDFDAIDISGIRSVTATDIQLADKLGYVIKLVAMAHPVLSGDRPEIAQWVRPCLVPKTSAIGSVNGVNNAVIAEGDFVGQVMISGPGAGEGATASAVVADLLDLARGRQNDVLGIPAGDLQATTSPTAWQQAEAAFYLRFSVSDQPGVLATITKALADAGISVASAVQLPSGNDAHVSLTLTTHSSSWARLLPVLDDLNSHDFVHEPVVSLQILEA